jgi:hypothetical protein
MATPTTNRVISYFFLFDFHHLKGSSDELDLVPESIIYFYPLKEDIKRQVFNNLCEKKNQMLFYFAHENFSKKKLIQSNLNLLFFLSRNFSIVEKLLV